MNNTWIKTGLLTIALLAGSLVGANQATAQRTDDMSLTVTANNIGIFECNLSATNFDFGDVDADGTTSSTGIAGARNGSPGTGAVYEQTSAVTWTCNSAPPSDVDISLTSLTSDHIGTMHDDDLEVRIPDVDSGSSADYIKFGTTGDLITGLTVGNGANAVSGDVDLRLTVHDDDPVGGNTWTVNLRATGNP